MPSRRQIREAVVQFLYAEGPAGLPAQPEDSPALALLLEPPLRKVTVARARAMAHLQQGREAVSEALQPFASELARLPAQVRRELEPLTDLVAAEQDAARHLDALRRELHGHAEPAALAGTLDDLRDADAGSSSAASRLEASVPEFPAAENLRREALAVAAVLPPYHRRCLAALAADPGPEYDLRGLRRALAAVAELRAGIEERVATLATGLPAVDEAIAAAVENYSPERLDRVDRAILRLATWEMLHDDDVPPPVAIDEAIELARRFGTTGSPAFVNGVLDRIRKAASSQPQVNL